MNSLANDFADYVLKLSEAAKKTRVAEDRQLYSKYKADAGVLLALLVSDAERDVIVAAIESHERLWGHTWLQDDAFKKPAIALDVFKKRFLAE